MNKQLIKKYAIRIFVFLLVSFLFQWSAGDQLKYKTHTVKMTEVNSIIGELADGTTVQQSFTVESDTIQKIRLYFFSYGRTNTGVMELALWQPESEEVLYQAQIEASLIQDGWFEIEIDLLNYYLRGKTLVLQITGNCPAGESPSLYYHNQDCGNGSLSINGQSVNGSLGYEIEGGIYYSWGNYYWLIVLALGCIGGLYSIYLHYCDKQGKKNWILIFSTVYKKYNFLISQLVARDFKTKYKRSVLGYLWSFLNPLMTMAVQYIVFSTIFKSGIENFPVYLLSGVVFFNFFIEAVGLGLTSIVGNAALITKVYVPKYIYPVTRVLSSTINLVISLIPLFLLSLLTGANLTKAVFLLFVPISCVLIFSIGLALVLSTSMVFFRDTQYLWGIINMAWMYLTPLFYPVDILPPQFQLIVQWNPMYRIVNFVRIVLIQGRSPELSDYFACIGFAIGMLFVGAWIFKKNQHKFVLYI